MSSLITCSHVGFGYENYDAVVDVSMKVDPGDYMCIVGENGAGKSTIMNLITGAAVKDGGNIKIFGKDQ